MGFFICPEFGFQYITKEWSVKFNPGRLNVIEEKDV